jgi:hypothetical protein
MSFSWSVSSWQSVSCHFSICSLYSLAFDSIPHDLQEAVAFAQRPFTVTGPPQKRQRKDTSRLGMGVSLFWVGIFRRYLNSWQAKKKGTQAWPESLKLL